MRFTLIFVFTILAFLSLSGTQATASMNIAGYLRTEGGETIFIDGKSLLSRRLKPYTESARLALLKLKDLDGINGTATLVDDVLLLETVEFVGLRRLIGYWQSPKTVVNFRDFTRVNFRLPASNSEYRYAISPTGGDSWKVFFSDKSSVTLGTLTISESTASLDLYDSETGEATEHYDLKKVSN